MQLDNSSKVFSKVSWFDQIDSTNLELMRQLDAEGVEFAAVLAGSQTAGQGRLGRQWQSPSGSSLSLSISTTRLGTSPGWLTLLAALAVNKMLANNGISAGIKWPNDVLVNGKKICGILATMTRGFAIIGIGVNLRGQSEDLNAVSLAELGVELDADSAAAQIGAELKELFAKYEANATATRVEYANASITLGQRVRAELPGGKEIVGVASEIAPGGELVILTPEPQVVGAGDVWHLRS